jgi:hypothetical protein
VVLQKENAARVDKVSQSSRIETGGTRCDEIVAIVVVLEYNRKGTP